MRLIWIFYFFNHTGHLAIELLKDAIFQIISCLALTLHAATLLEHLIVNENTY